MQSNKCYCKTSSDMPQSDNLQKGDTQRHAGSGSTSCLLQILRLGACPNCIAIRVSQLSADSATAESIATDQQPDTDQSMCSKVVDSLKQSQFAGISATACST